MKSMLPLAFLTVMVLACTRREEPPAPSPAASPKPDAEAGTGVKPEDEAAAAGEAVTLVRIDPEMLRDLRITTAKVETRPGAESAAAPGELRVAESGYAEVGAPVPARAVRVAVTAGQPVKRGQLLAELQSLELGKTRGDYREAQARVELARQALERKRGLAQERIAPLREVQEAEAELKSAEARLASAGAVLQAMGASTAGEGAALILRAPLSGTVIERNVVPGQVTEPAQALFRIGSLSKLWVVAHAPERDAVRVPLRSTARVAIPALPGQRFSARVLLVGSQVEMSSRTIPVRLELPNPGGVLRPGMSATIWLPVGEGAPVIAVPAASLQRLGDKWCVFVPKNGSAFEARVVGRGRDLAGEVEILDGVQPGETVVVEGAFLLKAEAEKARGEGADHDHH